MSQTMHQMYLEHSPTYTAYYKRFGAYMTTPGATKFAAEHGTTLEELEVKPNGTGQVGTLDLFTALGY